MHTWPNGRTAIVGLRFAPALLGAECVLLNREHAASAIAVTECSTIRVPADHLRARLEWDTALSLRVHLDRCDELRRQTELITWLSSMSARERLRAFLDDLVGELAGQLAVGKRVVVPLREWELAQLLAITPQYMSRLMHELGREGRLVRREGHWEIVARVERPGNGKGART